MQRYVFTVCDIKELNVNITATTKNETIALSDNKVLNVSIKESDSSFSLTSLLTRSVVNLKHTIKPTNDNTENTPTIVVNA